MQRQANEVGELAALAALVGGLAVECGLGFCNPGCPKARHPGHPQFRVPEGEGAGVPCNPGCPKARHPGHPALQRKSGPFPPLRDDEDGGGTCKTSIRDPNMFALPTCRQRRRSGTGWWHRQTGACCCRRCGCGYPSSASCGRWRWSRRSEPGCKCGRA